MRSFLFAVLVVAVSLIGFLTVAASVSQPVRAEAPEGQEEAVPSQAGTNIQVQRKPQSSVAKGLLDRAGSSWPWYTMRASGLVAAVALILLMLSGVGFLTGHTFSFLEPITGWATHRALGITFGVAVLVHVVSLLFDTFVPFGLVQVLVPFASDYRPISLFGVNFGSLYVALGVLSLYLVAAIVLTSLVWVEKRPGTWKVVHLLSYLVMLFVFVHALFLGTDLARGVLRWLWVALAAVVAYASLARLWRAGTV